MLVAPALHKTKLFRNYANDQSSKLSIVSFAQSSDCISNAIKGKLWETVGEKSIKVFPPTQPESREYIWRQMFSSHST